MQKAEQLCSLTNITVTKNQFLESQPISRCKGQEKYRAAGLPDEMNPDNLLSKIIKHVEGIFQSDRSPYLSYHNLDHTRLVVQHVEEIASQYGLDDKSLFILLAAAWFHDTGQLAGNSEGHEKKSVQLMKNFFTGKGIDRKVVNSISRCIMATKMPATPSSLLEQIMCDADTYHLGTKDFPQLDSLVWKEIEHRLKKTVGNKVQKSLVFLEKHRFFTSYCQQLLSKGKEKNMAQLISICKK